MLVGHLLLARLDAVAERCELDVLDGIAERGLGRDVLVVEALVIVLWSLLTQRLGVLHVVGGEGHHALIDVDHRLKRLRARRLRRPALFVRVVLFYAEQLVEQRVDAEHQPAQHLVLELEAYVGLAVDNRQQAVLEILDGLRDVGVDEMGRENRQQQAHCKRAQQRQDEGLETADDAGLGHGHDHGLLAIAIASEGHGRAVEVFAEPRKGHRLIVVERLLARLSASEYGIRAVAAGDDVHFAVEEYRCQQC